MHTLLGLYVWEWASSLPFEVAVVLNFFKKGNFRWPMIFYFGNRYSMLFAMIGIVIAVNTKEIDCPKLYTFNLVVGNASIGFASINLSFRAIAVWYHRWYIVTPVMLAIIIGHWSLLLYGVLSRVDYISSNGGCVIAQTNNVILASSFIYTMCFDCLVFALTSYKLIYQDGLFERSRLSNMMFTDGLIYTVLTFLANMAATIFMLLNLNGVMSIIANFPAAMLLTIASCRAVKRLCEFADDPEDFSPSTMVFSRRGHLAGMDRSDRDIAASGLFLSSFRKSGQSLL